MSALVEGLLPRVDLDAVLRERDAAAWNEAWGRLSYRPVGYAAEMLAYQHAYLRGAGWEFDDISLVLRIDGRPCGLWPLTLGGPAGGPRLSSAGAAIAAPVFAADLPSRSIKKLCARALTLVSAICNARDLPPPVLEQGPHPGTGNEGATPWHQQAMALGATPTVRHDLFADLRPSLSDIRATFRKSFRPLVNVGLRTWSVFVMSSANVDAGTWSEFKQLHCTVSGRSTRSDESWSLQFQMIASGSAFLVGLRDPASATLVGAGFFQYTRDEGLYAVAAYDRALFDKPLGHAVQQRAIETLKEFGVAWYRIGERSYAQDVPAPTDKELAIAAFKQGFASHVMCRFKFSLPPQVSATVESE